MASFEFIFRHFQILGLFPFCYKNSNGVFGFVTTKNSAIYSIILGIVLGLCQIYVIYCEICLNISAGLGKSTNIILVFCNALGVLSLVMVFLPTLKKKEAFCFWLNRTGYLFSNLEEKNLKKLCAFYKCLLAVLVFFLLLNLSNEFYVYYMLRARDGEETSIYFWPDSSVLLNYFLSLWIKLFAVLLLMFVNLLRFYYEETNEKLKSGKDNHDRNFWLRFLRELRLKDLEIKDLVEFLHSFFIPLVSLQLLQGFFATLGSVILVVDIGVPQFVQLMWIAHAFWDKVVVVACCHVAENEAEKSVHYLHELFISWDNKEIKKEIDILSLQLQHRRFEFNALGCHKINFSLIYWMGGLIASYTVILVQTHLDLYEERNPVGKLQTNCSLV